ncbi:MAG: tRNA (N6-isopentenyl adenosine(37)-C2)-methylthiotransferase MiaB [Actinomycetota bacterium]|nr:tRNA (N6-isopentenyl adenosine(37)-C2)-methylthiotransferase MiaB [Actinomycetota bacterium]
MHPRQNRHPYLYYLRTHGCQMNVHDSEHISGVLEKAGYQRTDLPQEADVVIFNTCSVRKSAEDKVWGALQAISGKGQVVAVCGCMARRLGADIFTRAPRVNLVFGVEELGKIVDLIEMSKNSQVLALGNVDDCEIDSHPTKRNNFLSAWVPISYGCSRFCSYCVVPYVRGRERSRPFSEILAEVDSLASEGTVEVILLGQNVNSYGRDFQEPIGFAEVLDFVASVEGIRRVKFETSHPRDISYSLFEVMRNREEVCPHLHLPFQSGSDRVLKHMRRGYDRQFYLDVINHARELVPGISLTTDIIVGFPGETESDFEDTLALVEEAQFDFAYIFKYSSRENTRAYLLEAELGKISEADKTRRFLEVSRLQDEITERALKRFVGREEEVITLSHAKKGPYVIGRTATNHIVLLPEKDAPIDSLIRARITASGKHALRGEVQELLIPKRVEPLPCAENVLRYSG